MGPVRLDAGTKCAEDEVFEEGKVSPTVPLEVTYHGFLITIDAPRSILNFLDTRNR